MKKYILLLLLTLLSFSNYSKTIHHSDCSVKISNFYGIADGWYQATIRYSNYNTGTRATYTLNVKVEYGTVSKIDFGNGGSIHSGYNNEGYIYSGGYLSYETDFSGNIVAATATVTTSDTDGIRSYQIRIE